MKTEKKEITKGIWEQVKCLRYWPVNLNTIAFLTWEQFIKYLLTKKEKNKKKREKEIRKNGN